MDCNSSQSIPCLDSCRTWSRSRHSVEPQASEESLLFTSYLDQFLFFHLQRPPLCGWSEIASQVALTYAASVIVGLAAKPAGRPDLIRSPKRVLAHLWEGDSQL